MNGTAKPVPPPRDHLRIEKDGRLTNRLPAPQVPARTVSTIPPVNNNVPREQPTKQELEAIRKFEVSFGAFVAHRYELKIIDHQKNYFGSVFHYETRERA